MSIKPAAAQLMPWVLATQTPPEVLRRWAVAFAPVLGLNQLVTIGTAHAYEEFVDLAVVGITSIVCALLVGAEYLNRKRAGQAGFARSVRLRARLAAVFYALIMSYPYLQPAQALHDYSGYRVGTVARLIDTNLLARGIFCAVLLIGSTLAFLCVAFIAFGSRAKANGSSIQR